MPGLRLSVRRSASGCDGPRAGQQCKYCQHPQGSFNLKHDTLRERPIGEVVLYSVRMRRFHNAMTNDFGKVNMISETEMFGGSFRRTRVDAEVPWMALQYVDIPHA